ncbi:MAG: M24 family metallopeptidase, partial [Bryocella sp.]
AVDDRVRNYRHAVPRDGVLDRFGMVNFCARRWGLCISMTRFVHFGPMPQELADKFAAIAIVNAKLTTATKEGKTSGELFDVVKNAYLDAGYEDEETMHHQGGATGYAEREWIARPGGTDRVQNEQAFAWNPSLQGAKVEDTILVTKDGFELLTPTPELPVVRTEIDGQTVESAGVLLQ